MTRADRIVARARTLIGARFRPQGRDAALGLDCIGVATMAFGLPRDRIRGDYGLRGGSSEALERELARFFDEIAPAHAGPGDLLLVSPGSAQLHVAILTPAGYLHADAGLRRAVEVPGKLPWPIISAWRINGFADEGALPMSIGGSEPG